MILDTNGLSAFTGGTPPVVQQTAAADELRVPVIVLRELSRDAHFDAVPSLQRLSWL